MAKVRRVLAAVSIEVAQRRRICYHDRTNHSIERGCLCLVIKEPNSGQKNYCVTCGLEILDRAADDLAALRKGLS